MDTSKPRPFALLLSQAFEPHRVIRWETSIKLMYDSSSPEPLVEVLETYDGYTLSSPSLTIQQPAVLRLLKSMPHKKRAVKFSRSNVYTRDHYTCFGAGTRILMADARQLPIESVRAGDRVLDAFGEPQSVIACNERITDRAVSIKHRGSFERTVTTPEHPFLASTGEFVPIGDKPDYLTFPRTVIYDCKDSVYEVASALPSDKWLRLRNGRIFWSRRGHECGVPMMLRSSADLAYLLGLYCAEGSSVLPQGVVCLSFSSDEEHTLAADAARLLHTLFGVNVAVDIRPHHSCVVRTSSKALALVLRELCGHRCNHKRIPHAIIGPHHAAFLRGLVLGDGHIDRIRRKVALTMTSYDVIFGAQTLLWGLGIYPTVQTNNEKADRLPIWSLVMNADNYSRFLSIVLGEHDAVPAERIFGDDRFVFRKLQAVDPLEGDTVVYNLETTGSHSYIANGMAVHNCQYCGQRKPASMLNYDHVLPRRQGGQTEWSNIATSCFPCNTKKDNRTPEQAGMPLLRKPVKPAWLPTASLYVERKKVPSEWLAWLGDKNEAESVA